MAVDLAKNFKFGDANLKVHNGVVDAGHPDFTGANNAEKVDAAIQFANTNNHPLCLVPESLIPYDPTAMPNGHLDAVRMVREGQQIDIPDVKAWGAAGDGPGGTDDLNAINEAASWANSNDYHSVHHPPGTYTVSADPTFPSGVDPVGGEATYDGSNVTIYGLSPSGAARFRGNPIRELRSPTLTVQDYYPKEHWDLEIVWADGDTLYASQQYDGVIWKSTDGGETWSHQGQPGINVGLGAFLKLATGTLLLYSGGSPNEIHRSTDDGASWTKVHDLRTDRRLLGPGSWAEDGNGDVYYIEYHTVDGGTTRIYRSTDDGASWSQYHEFASATLRHGHGVQHDPVSGDVFFMTGDSDNDAGIYRIDGAGGVEQVLLNKNTSTGTAARSIGVCFFTNYIAWATDAPADPYLYRLDRDDFGATSTPEEQIYKVNSSGWWTMEADANRDSYLMSASQESGSGSPIDTTVHLYHISDEGLSVSEVASAPVPDSNGIPAIAPVGTAEQGGDDLWIQDHAILPSWQARVTVAQGGLQGFPAVVTSEHEDMPTGPWNSASIHRLSVAAGGNEEWYQLKTPNNSSTIDLYIANLGVWQSSGSGDVVLWVYNNDTTTKILTEGNRNMRGVENEPSRPWFKKASIDARDIISFRIKETSGSNSATASAFVTWGWG